MRNGWTPLVWMLLFLFVAAIGAWAGEGGAADGGGAVPDSQHRSGKAAKARPQGSPGE